MGFNVLVVDDSAMMRRVIVRSLGLSGLALGDVYEAANGAEALAVLDRHWVDVVLADLNMPVMAGDEMIARMREDPATASTPVIVISTDQSEARRGQLGGQVAGFIHKPFAPETLDRMIRHVLGVAHGDPA